VLFALYFYALFASEALTCGSLVSPSVGNIAFSHCKIGMAHNTLQRQQISAVSQVREGKGMSQVVRPLNILLPGSSRSRLKASSSTETIHSSSFLFLRPSKASGRQLFMFTGHNCRRRKTVMKDKRRT